MKCGGNASFADFLLRHPGSHSYSSSSTDIRDKYTSRAATLYKEELQKRIADDERQFGKAKVHVDGSAADKLAAAPAPAGDFFDTWDAAPAVKSPSLAPAANTLPTFGLSPRATPTSSRPVSPRPTSTSPLPAPPVQPRTVTSSSLRPTAKPSSTSTSRPGTLGARSISSGSASSGPSITGRGKLGVKKGGTVNFEEAERRAKEEQDRIDRLGYDSRLEEEAAAAAALSSAKSIASGGRGAAPTAQASKKDSIEVERLGMGIKRLGFGQTTGVSGEQAAKEAAAAAKAATRRANGYEDEGTRRFPFLLPFLRLPRR